MTRTLLRIFALALLITLVALSVLQVQISAAPVPVPAVAPASVDPAQTKKPCHEPNPTTETNAVAQSAPAVRDPTLSSIEKRRLLGSLLGGLSNVRNDDDLATTEGPINGNKATVGAR
ncbi:hypothetical protein BGX23_011890 [Mortierella sp. AD031]|nr:hypothetical protein BGX23_011890 [Mortierella sp. AD031]KAG0203287.1 hypothetical protein BGX33_009188 [Mortierella sp. NVP41]